ncbi:response regulator receiver modulated diguanylate cyclase [Tamilnaduibacter salinus]|uniref:Response regulator receiver modulated diguanylate cyclase n=1 Tax=Tamilnaduibacter salinus TaxID=1484056 RepID=A0A2U1D1M2_9GAMM|nr:response regulator [Tamilnaduibacter salinus]PVY79208.1 response regulator receiver modulated diguanylate cyclase [Tamilnaduibacter salinus]
MPNPDLPILVVDDARFSSMVVSRALQKAGYRDVRIANDAPSALHLLEERPVSVLIADWLMPEMDGLDLTDRIRQQDEQKNHYTYIILLTAKESMEALSQAFDRGVDDFIYKSDMNKQLVPRVFAANRMADRQNALLASNALLLENNRQLSSSSIADPETGLGNARYARQRLQESLRQCESRGGATAMLLIGLRGWSGLARRHGESAMAELAQGIGRRLNSLIRPLDALCRLQDDRFAIIAHFPDAERCSTGAFRRLYEGINHKAVKTAAGFIEVEAAMTLCQADAGRGTPDPATMEQTAQEGLSEALSTRRFTEVRPSVTEQA